MDKRLFLLVCVFFILPIKINAFCDSSKLSKYKVLSSYVDNYYEFDEDDKKFDIVIYNLRNDFFIVEKGSNHEYGADSNGEVRLSDLSAGQTVSLFIFPNDSDCRDFRVRIIYINLPYYNSYYNDSVCKNSSNNLCSKWANTSMYSYDQFVSKVKAASSEEIIDPIKEKEKIENKYGFLDFLADYYILILLLIIVFGSYGIYVLDKKSKFDF